MQAVAGNGHTDDSGPGPETQRGAVSRETYLEMPQEDKNSLIYEELGAIRGEMTRAEFARASREETRRKDYESRERARDKTIEDLGGKIDASINDARADRMSHANERREIQDRVSGLAQNQLRFDAKLDSMPAVIAAEVTKAVTAKVGSMIDNVVKAQDNRNTTFERQIEGLKREDADIRQEGLRAHGRITLLDQRVEEKELEQDDQIAAIKAEIGTVPHELETRGSLSDQTPEQRKLHEDNAKKGTGIKGHLAALNNNLVTMNAGRLMLAGGALLTPGALVEIGKAWGPEWAIGIASLGTLIGFSLAKAKKTRARIAAWWAARRIKVTEKKP